MPPTRRQLYTQLLLQRDAARGLGLMLYQMRKTCPECSTQAVGETVRSGAPGSDRETTYRCQHGHLWTYTAVPTPREG